MTEVNSEPSHLSHPLEPTKIVVRRVVDARAGASDGPYKEPGLVQDQHRVDLWRVSLQQHPRRLEGAGRLLAPGEMRSVEKMVEPQRSRRLLARASLRIVLSGYVGLSPTDLQFTYGAWGKPALKGRPASQGLEFNLSTTEDSCLIAVSRAGLVGVDIEAMAAVPHAQQLARRFFAPAEAAALEAGDDGGGVQHFLRYWTAKEAYAKALGQGLSFPLAACVIPEQFMRRKSVAACDSNGKRWILIRSDPTRDVVGSLAVQTEAVNLTVLEMTLGSHVVADYAVGAGSQFLSTQHMAKRQAMLGISPCAVNRPVSCNDPSGSFRDPR